MDLVYTSKTIRLNSSTATYNPSIAFVSEDTFVICDGGGTLEFVIENNTCPENFLFDDIEPAVILDARYIKESSKIIVALYKIDEDKDTKFSRLIFLFYDLAKNAVDQSRAVKLIQKQKLKMKGVIEHVYIEENGNFCQIIGQDQIEFEYDSLNPVKTKDNTGANDTQLKIPKYCWSQDEDSVTVYVKVPEKYANIMVKVETTPVSVLIAVGDTVLLSGKTPYRLESELTTWKRKDDTVEVELAKHESGLMWSELIKGDTGGEYLPNEALVNEIHSRYHSIVLKLKVKF